ncbi:MAG: hypothetical protein K2K56_01265 [Lachnospiraceae bacterium]|nr:hypothetical protein [Lachnospiraceae bacterium]
MNKQDKKLALSVLAALAAGIALIYTLIMYYDIIFAVAGMSVIFLITAFIMTQNIIAFASKQNTSYNIRMRDSIDDISTLIENMSSIQTRLAKANFIYTRQIAQSVVTLENNYAESQEALYKNLSYISNAQNKSTKLMIKYDLSNTTKLISTLKDLRNQLSNTMIQGFDQIQPNNTDMVSLLEDIVNYLKAQPSGMDEEMSTQLNNLAQELQNISHNIEHIQIPAPIAVPADMPLSQTASQPVAAEAIADNIQPAEGLNDIAETDSTLDDLLGASQNEGSDSLDDLLGASQIENNGSLDDLLGASQIESSDSLDDLLNTANELDTLLGTSQTEDTDIASTLFDASPAESNNENDTSLDNLLNATDSLDGLLDSQTEADTLQNAAPIAAQEESTPTFTVIDGSQPKEEATQTDTAENANKQLSPDEISALFAAAEPSPKKAEAETPPAVSTEPSDDNPNKQLSSDEIAALFAAAEPSPAKDATAEEKEMDEAIAKAAPAPATLADIPDDPNKQLSPDEIAALFASM